MNKRLLEGINLQNESVEFLMRKNRQLRKYYYRHQVSLIVISLFFIGFGIFAYFQAPNFDSVPITGPKESPLFYRIITIPLILGRLILANLLLVAYGLILFGTCFLVIHILLMFFNYPKPGTTYLSTIDKYLSNSLFQKDGNPFQLFSFVCLLQCARDSVNDDYLLYVKYCRGLGERIISQYKETCDISIKDQISLSLLLVKEVRVIHDSEDLLLCEASIEIKIKKAEGDAEKKIPSMYYVLYIPVAHVGMYWFIGNVEWRGYLTRDPHVPESERISVKLTP